MRYSIIFLAFSIFLSCQSENQPKSTFISKSTGQIGIDFINELEDNKDQNGLKYESCYFGGGVGIIDVNNDGLQDIFFSGNQVNDALYLNKGNWTFEDITKSANINSNGWSTGVSIVDINNDGWQDIYVCRSLLDEPQARKNVLYINQQNNTFTEHAETYGLADVWRTQEACFFDFDKDGDQDVLMVNQPPNPGPLSPIKGPDYRIPELGVRFYRNDNFKFVDVTNDLRIDHKGYALSASVSDFNNDGWLDLFIAHDYNSPDKLYLNIQGKYFRNTIDQSCQQLSFFSMGTDAGDLNNDNIDDIISLDMVASDPYRNKANMGGMNPKAFWRVVNEGGHYQYMYNAVHLSQEIENGIPYYSNVSQMLGMASSDWSWSPIIADFNNDSKNDVFVTNGIKRDIRFSDVVNALVDTIKTIKAQNKIEQKDLFKHLDYKELLDRFPSSKIQNHLYLQKEALAFKDVTAELNLNQKGFSNGAAFADLDNDGDLDLITNNVNDAPFIYENQITNSNFISVLPQVDERGFNPAGIKVAVYNKNKSQSQIIKSNKGFYSSSEQIAHFGLGNEHSVDSVVVYWPNESRSILKSPKINTKHLVKKTATLNKISPKKIKPIINFATAYGLNYKHQENNFDDYKKQVLLPYQIGVNNVPLAVADFNGDALDDIFIGQTINQKPQILLQKEGRFSKSDIPILRGKECTHLCYADFDADGDLDIYAAYGGNEFDRNSSEYANYIFVNNGSGQFDPIQDKAGAFDSDGVVVPVDINADGKMDLFLGGRHVPGKYPLASDSKILINSSRDGKIQFEDVTLEWCPQLKGIGMLTNAKAKDIDHDGDQDIVIAGEWMPLTILINDGKQLRPSQIENSTGWHRGLELEDINGDGKMDILLGNLGDNAKYKVNDKQGFSVYYNAEQSDESDIILAYEKNDKEYPVRGRSCSSEQMPELLDKFPSFHEFALADIKSIYDDKLASCDKFQAENFKSGVYFNRGDLSFEFKAFPRYAQMSIINDFKNLEGNQWLLTGNLEYMEIETPRLDGCYGHLLSFDEEGGISNSKKYVGQVFSGQINDIHDIQIGGESYLVFIPLNETIRLVKKSDLQ